MRSVVIVQLFHIKNANMDKNSLVKVAKPNKKNLLGLLTSQFG